jgi:SAM-dependent methyltransferase
LCASYIEFSRRAFPEKRLKFVQGDAQALPFRDGSADCVLSIQSAHCYPDFGRFLAEAYRVLKPGGTLAISDIWDLELFPWDWRVRESQLVNCGLTVTTQGDITAEVCEALTLENGFAAELTGMRTKTNSPLVDSMLDGLERIQASLAGRRSSYRAWTLRKPAKAA